MNGYISTESLSDKFIRINHCDCQHLSGVDAGSVRMKGRVDYHILYIAEGTCFVTVNGKEIAASEGSVIIYLPHQPQAYKFKAEIPSVSYYVHFTGIGCEEILRELNLYDNMIFNIGKSGSLENLFSRLIEEVYTDRPFGEQYCHGLLINILAHIARKRYYQLSDISCSRNKTVSDICKLMHYRYSDNLSVEDYAQICHLSTSRFTHVFADATGKSPKQYLIEIKIKKAMELLENTDLAISNIADITGFADSNYFSRVFKKFAGKTPREYRDDFN